MVKDLLADELKLDTRVTTLGHVQRGGAPCAYDRMLGTLQGAEAVNAVLDATPETESPIITVIENKICRKPLMEAVRLTQLVPKAIEAKDFKEAMRLRDAEFTEYFQAYQITAAASQPELLLPPEKRMRIGIIHVGAPCGGINAASRGAVAYCLARGHTPVGLYNGFSGLIRHHDDKPLGSVRDISWLEADAWVSRGGSEIGTYVKTSVEAVQCLLFTETVLCHPKTWKLLLMYLKSTTFKGFLQLVVLKHSKQ